MIRSTVFIGEAPIPVLQMDVVVIGSGCAGFNAADWLYDLGRTDIAILTEGVQMGTSRNTGSDKQTYYKLNIAGDGVDSVRQMAEDLFCGEGVNGDTALAEAANSVRSFIKLANLGVPFPTNRYGEYVGYKTDHDPRQRATSAGPLTSKFMTECLERSVIKKGIPILDGMTAVRLLAKDTEIEGLLCLDRSTLDGPAHGLTIIRAKRVIMATGGPAGCYLTSVYPESQTGMSGMALEAGAQGANLQEWQYGLASVKFRWNVSGTYQQVLPKYISVDRDGVKREFLLDYFKDPSRMLKMQFLKGYQWPFDSTKINGSSMVDILVHHEVFDLGRHVYLDFRSEPAGMENGFGSLDEEAYAYLQSSKALLKTPIARLKKMNLPAIELYLEHGIDLYREPLEICVCAQHHNGGIAVDDHWQTTVRGLYAVGEAAGTFGVRRPGGSALNSTQVGSLRAAEHIAYTTPPNNGCTDSFMNLACEEARRLLEQLKSAMSHGNAPSQVLAQRRELSADMSSCAAHIRNPERMRRLEAKLRQKIRDVFDTPIAAPYELPDLLKNRDIFITQLAVLSAMQEAAQVTASRGGALVMNAHGATENAPTDSHAYEANRPQKGNRLMQTVRMENNFISSFVEVRPIPTPDNWFENVWNDYRCRTGLDDSRMAGGKDV